MLRTDSSDALQLAIRDSGLIRPADRVLVAVSGGPDSIALLVAMCEFGRDVVAAHFDHALKAGSELVAEQVRELCTRLGVDLIVERRTAPMPRGSMQAGARSLRYAFFERAVQSSNADVVALGHTADDLVEGVVLHLMRGCGLAGLRGMPARRGRYVRPLLSVWRSEVVDFLQRHAIVPYQDPANRDTNFARVRVRLEILPAFERDRPGITRRFHAAALSAATRHDSVAAQAARLLQKGGASRSEVAQVAEPLAAEVMSHLYTKAGGVRPALSRSHLASMIRLAGPGRGGRGVDLPGGLRFRIVGDNMEVVATATDQHTQSREAVRLEVRTCMGCADDLATHMKADVDLRLGYRRPGLRMRPAGGRGTRKLQDIFVDARVPREDRDAWPLVFAGEQLAWIPGIAVAEGLASAPGEPSVHVAITRMPVRSSRKVASLGPPDSPPGEPS